MSERMKIKNVVMTIAAKEIIYAHAQRFFHLASVHLLLEVVLFFVVVFCF